MPTEVGFEEEKSQEYWGEVLVPGAQRCVRGTSEPRAGAWWPGRKEENVRVALPG